MSKRKQEQTKITEQKSCIPTTAGLQPIRTVTGRGVTGLLQTDEGLSEISNALLHFRFAILNILRRRPRALVKYE